MLLSSLKVRLFTNDQFVLDKVLYSNFYKLKKLPENSVVVDVGAHVGFFTVSALLMGAGKVYSYEPIRSNFDSLLENTKDFGSKVVSNNFGVLFDWGFVDFNIPVFNQQEKSFDFANIEIEQKGEFDRMPVVGLSELLQNIPEEKIELLKISTSGNELEILANCEDLSKVSHIVGETSQTDVSAFEKTIENLKSKGFKNSWFSNSENETSRVFVFSKGDSSSLFDIYAKV